MNPGQKMYDTDGNQICLFPLPFLIVTQWNGVNTYSHCCGHPVDYGTYGEPHPVYAPFDCHLVRNTGTAAHTLMYCSDKPVVTPSGLQWVTIQLTHASNPPYLNSAKQGDLIYYSGKAGAAAVHLHMDQTFVKDANWYACGLTCSGGMTGYQMNGSVNPNEVFYVNDTNIIDGDGKTWYTYTGPTPPDPDDPDPPAPPDPGPGQSDGEFKWWLAKQLFKRRNNM